MNVLSTFNIRRVSSEKGLYHLNLDSLQIEMIAIPASDHIFTVNSKFIC